VIQKDGLNFLSLYFKIRTSDKYGVNYIMGFEHFLKSVQHCLMQGVTMKFILWVHFRGLRRRNARCTAVAESVLMNSRTQ